MSPRRRAPIPRRPGSLVRRGQAPLARRPHLRHRGRGFPVGLVLIGGLLLLLLLAAVTRIRILLPLLILAVILWGLYLAWRWVDRQQAQAQHQTQQQQDQLNNVFYDLIQRYQGRISVLDFAMNAKVDAATARAFLDQKAQEFFANFEPIDNGDVIYVFNSLGVR